MFKKLIQSDLSSSSSAPSISPQFGSLSPTSSNLNNNDQSSSSSTNQNNSGGHNIVNPNSSSNPSAPLGSPQSSGITLKPKETPQLSKEAAAAIAAAVAASNLASSTTNNNSNNNNSTRARNNSSIREESSDNGGKNTKPTLFANDSEVIFSIFLDTIIRTRGQDQPKRQDQKVMKPQNY